MIDKNRILTICIPTYNRKKYLKNQLSFFQNQINKNRKLLDQVRFIISDNASTDGTPSMLESWDQNLRFFDFYSNKTNLGLIKNINVLLNYSNTEYVWFVSDDDELKDGVIEKVLDVLNNFQTEYIFINYSSKNNFNKIAYTGRAGFHSDAKSTALKIFNEAYGSLVFITACVYRRDHLLEIQDQKMASWISAPLFYSFYCCSKGSIFIIEDPMIVFNSNNASYAGIKRVLRIKFEEYIKILESLNDYGYSKTEVLKTIKHFFKEQSHAHFLYNFLNINRSLKMYKYYNIETILNFPVNIFKYILRITS